MDSGVTENAERSSENIKPLIKEYFYDSIPFLIYSIAFLIIGFFILFAEWDYDPWIELDRAIRDSIRKIVFLLSLVLFVGVYTSRIRSKNAISESKNFAQSVTGLFDFYEGDFISYNDWGGPEVFTEREDGQIIKRMNSTYDVETSKEKYRIAIQNVVDDTTNSDNVGIRSFYIIKAENDTDLQFAYRGDGEYTPGIHFNIKNSIPKNE